MQEWDKEDVEDDIDGEVTALQAIAALLEVEGDDALAWAQREALSDVAVEALALQERRKARENREAASRRTERAYREAEERAVREAKRLEEARQAQVTQRAARARDEAMRQRQQQHELPSRHRIQGQHPIESARTLKALPSHPTTRARPAQPKQRLVAPPVRPLQARRPPVAMEPASAPLISLTNVELPKHQPAVPIPSTPVGEQLHLTGADLADWRARLGLTQQAAAARLGVRQGTVSKAESRPSVLLGPALHQALADASRR